MNKTIRKKNWGYHELIKIKFNDQPTKGYLSLNKNNFHLAFIRLAGKCML